jgi:naphthoate synthase
MTDTARQALGRGRGNTVVPLAELAATTLQWRRDLLAMSRTAPRFLERAIHAERDGQAGRMQRAGSATLLHHTTDEGREGKQAFLEARAPDGSRFRRSW